MKCCSCGGEIRDNVRFCTLCGAPQPDPEAVAEAPAVETVVSPEEEPIAAPVSETAFEPVLEPIPEPAPAPQPVAAAPVATAQPVYQTVYQTAAPAPRGPMYKLPTRRGLGKMFFLGLITGGIYNMVIMSRMAEEMNMVVSRHDGQRTQQFAWVSILSVLTLGVYSFVWIHGLCNRMGWELKRRGINYKFSAKTFWLWGILGSLLIGIGPFIYVFKLCKASNLINRDYNING